MTLTEIYAPEEGRIEDTSTYYDHLTENY